MIFLRYTLLISASIVSIQLQAASALASLKQARQELLAGQREIVAGKDGLKQGYQEVYNQVVVPITSAAQGVDEQLETVKKAYDICRQIEFIEPLISSVYGNTGLIVKGLYQTVQEISTVLHNVKDTVEPVNEKINPSPATQSIPEVYQKLDQAEKDLGVAINQLQQIIADFGELLDVL